MTDKETWEKSARSQLRGVCLVCLHVCVDAGRKSPHVIQSPTLDQTFFLSEVEKMKQKHNELSPQSLLNEVYIINQH